MLNYESVVCCYKHGYEPPASKKAGNLLTSGITVSIPRRIPFQDVSDKKAHVNPAQL